MSPTTALITVDEYLRLSVKPNCEYRDGVVTQKAWPDLKHSRAQTRVSVLIYERCSGFVSCPNSHAA